MEWFELKGTLKNIYSSLPNVGRDTLANTAILGNNYKCHFDLVAVGPKNSPNFINFEKLKFLCDPEMLLGGCCSLAIFMSGLLLCWAPSPSTPKISPEYRRHTQYGVCL